MGVYIYTMRAKQATINVDGGKHTANLLAYAFKPYWGDIEDQPRLFKQMLTRAENFWEDRDAPEYYVVDDKFQNGAEVRTGWRDGDGWCYDTPSFPGKHVGYLKKEGRKWIVVPTWEECHVAA